MFITQVEPRALLSFHCCQFDFYKNNMEEYELNWLYFPLRKCVCVTPEVIFVVCTLIENSYEPISVQEF